MLKGDMSLVDPRPAVPGLTCLWALEGRLEDTSADDSPHVDGEGSALKWIVGLSRLFRANSEIRAMIPELSIAAPATGGLPVAYGVTASCELCKQGVPLERVRM